MKNLKNTAIVIITILGIVFLTFFLFSIICLTLNKLNLNIEGIKLMSNGFLVVLGSLLTILGFSKFETIKDLFKK
jgi:hypothetical protein